MEDDFESSFQIAEANYTSNWLGSDKDSCFELELDEKVEGKLATNIVGDKRVVVVGNLKALHDLLRRDHSL